VARRHDDLAIILLRLEAATPSENAAAEDGIITVPPARSATGQPTTGVDAARVFSSSFTLVPMKPMFDVGVVDVEDDHSGGAAGSATGKYAGRSSRSRPLGIVSPVLPTDRSAVTGDAAEALREILRRRCGWPVWRSDVMCGEFRAGRSDEEPPCEPYAVGVGEELITGYASRRVRR